MKKSIIYIKVYENANMLDLIKKCDISISACGSTLYELCVINVPTKGIILPDSQRMVVKKMKEKVLIIESYYIDELEPCNLRSCINKLVNDMKLRNDIINNQFNFVDVNGINELISEINIL